MVASMDGSIHSLGTHSSSPFRKSSRRKVPPPRPRFERSGSEHMLPTSNLSPNKCVFSSKHRLIKRNLPFFQSKNKLQVTNQHSELRLFSLLKYDWFHVGLRVNLWLSLFILLSIWTIAIIIFAGVYMLIDKNNLNADCGLGAPGEPIQFSPAFAFSLETCTTVGYGLPNGSNSFFEGGCGGVQAAIYFQMVWSMMFNAFLFAFFFARIAKSEARGVQVIFSNKAIISNRPDVPYPCFQFRVFDVDGSYPVVEAHVRLYVVTQKSPIPIPLRIVIPNDDYGSMLLLSLPSQVVHAMDAYSPMVPHNKVEHYGTAATIPGDGLHLRQVDGSTNSRDDVVCPVCGESYGNVERLINHGKYQKMIEEHDGYSVKGSHQEIDWDELEDLLNKSTTWSLQQLQAYFRSNLSEILCIVEGIDPLASGTFQAIHSYQIQDINFGEAHFADCVCLNLKDELVVDLDFFHQIRPNVKPIPDSDRTAKSNNDVFAIKEVAEPTSTPDRASSVLENDDSSSNPPFEDTQEPLTEADQQQQEDKLVPRQLTYAEPQLGQEVQLQQQSNQHIKEPPTVQRQILQEAPTTPEQRQAPWSRHDLRHVSTPEDLKESLPTTATNTSGSSSQLELRQLPQQEQQQQLQQNLFLPGTKPRRYSAPNSELERPPPLFTLDDAIPKGKSERTLQQQQQEHQQSKEQPRVSMPSNMMNSLVTGKFD